MEDGGSLSQSWLEEEIDVLEAVYGSDVVHERGPDKLIVNSKLAPQIDEGKEFRLVSVELQAQVRRTGDVQALLSNFRGFSEEAIDGFRETVNEYARDLSQDGSVGSKALQITMFCIEQLSEINDQAASSATECVICSGDIEPSDLKNRETRRCVVVEECLHRFHRECIRAWIRQAVVKAIKDLVDHDEEGSGPSGSSLRKLSPSQIRRRQRGALLIAQVDKEAVWPEVLARSYQCPSCPLCRASFSDSETEQLISEEEVIEQFMTSYQGQIQIEFTSAL